MHRETLSHPFHPLSPKEGQFPKIKWFNVNSMTTPGMYPNQKVQRSLRSHVGTQEQTCGSLKEAFSSGWLCRLIPICKGKDVMVEKGAYSFFKSLSSSVKACEHICWHVIWLSLICGLSRTTVSHGKDQSWAHGLLYNLLPVGIDCCESDSSSKKWFTRASVYHYPMCITAEQHWKAKG